MPLQFGDDFCAACELIARIWRKGDDPVRFHPIAIVVVLDVHLPEPRNQLAGRVSNCSTHGVSCIECAAAHSNVMSI